VSLYLDANVIIALLTEDALAARAARFEAPGGEAVIVSDFCAAEFAAVIARRVRTRALTRGAARAILDRFDDWVRRSARRVELSPLDVAMAETYLRRLDLALVAPDAIHIAASQRLGAMLVTFDRAMAKAARTLGVAVVDM
jgi:uncharacterized protein